MKKKLVNLFTIMMATCMLAGCGSNAGDKALQDMDVEKYVTVGEYKGLEVTVAPISVNDSEVDSLVFSALGGATIPEEDRVMDQPVETDMLANIDYVGKKDGVAFEGGTAQGYNLSIGSGQFIPGFEEGLVGVMPGETVDLNLTFPETYQSAELAGAEVVFTVTVNYIAPMKDSIVATLGIEGVDTVDALRQYAYDYLYSNAEYNYNTGVENAVLTNFMNSCVFNEIPQSIVEKYKTMASEGITQQATSYGMDAESFVTTFYGMTFEEFLTEYSNEAAKQDMALQAVANKEGLNISDEELDATLQEYATAGGYATVEEFLGGESKDTYRAYLTCEKVLDFMIDNAVVNNE